MLNYLRAMLNYLRVYSWIIIQEVSKLWFEQAGMDWIIMRVWFLLLAHHFRETRVLGGR